MDRRPRRLAEPARTDAVRRAGARRSRGAPNAARCTTGCSTSRDWSASTTSDDEPAPHPAITQLRVRLNDIYAGELGEPFTTAGLCLYRDGNDSVAWHGDTIGRSSTEDTMVAIVSLGATRVFALRPRGGGRSLRLPQGHGDLLVMGGSCQRTWEHAVPKTTRPTGRGSASSSARATCAESAADAATAATSRSRARCVSTGATG